MKNFVFCNAIFVFWWTETDILEEGAVSIFRVEIFCPEDRGNMFNRMFVVMYQNARCYVIEGRDVKRKIYLILHGLLLLQVLLVFTC